MVFGDPKNERIQLNEDSVWAGPGEVFIDSKGTPQDLQELRTMIDEGLLAEADNFIIRKFSRGGIVRSHQTLGDVHIQWKGSDAGVVGSASLPIINHSTSVARSSFP